MRIQGSKGAVCRRADARWRLLCVALATSAMGGQAAMGGVNGGRGGTAGGGLVRMYVDDDAAPGGDGAGWATAFADLQSALDAAAGMLGRSIEIRVGQGTYAPTKRTDENDPRSATFQLANSISLLGGFAGVGASDPDERDWSRHETVLSGTLGGGVHAYHVLDGSGTDSTATLSGFVITGGSADVPASLPILTNRGGGLVAVSGGLNIQSCRFTDNFAFRGGAIYSQDMPQPTVSDCMFDNNEASNYGGAIRINGPAAMIIDDCLFEQNTAGNTGNAINTFSGDCLISNSQFVANFGDGGAVLISDGLASSIDHCMFASNEGVGAALTLSSTPDCVVSDCTFMDNTSQGGAGGMQADEPLLVDGCTFLRNSSELGAGGATARGLVSNCAFIDNDGWFGGGLLAIECNVSNSVFSGNSASNGGGIMTGTGNMVMSNCSFSGNSGGGLRLSNSGAGGTVTVVNSILWGNSPAQIDMYGGGPPNPPASLVSTVVVSYSCVQNGWTGVGNISSDPLFIQPGCDNARLGYGSPCINAGNNAAIPSGIVFDLDGQSRVQGGTVDIGAYEGGHEMLPLVACEEDLDAWEQAKMTPAGGPYNPINNAAVSITNITETPDATASAAQIDQPLHPGAPGFNELAADLAVTTSLAGGDMFMRVTIPFDESDLNGFAIEDMNVAWFDAAAAGDGGGAWRLAPEGDIALSPDHSGVMGDRIVVLTGGSPGFTGDVGDHGVFWNPDLERGYVWANVDHVGEFAAGVALPACVGDTAYPVDGVVNMADLQRVIESWGPTPAGPASFADLDRNGVVDIDDLMAVVRGWGPCAR